MDKISVIKKNGLPLNEQDKKNFRSRLAIVCFQLGFVIVEDDDKVESLPNITAEDLQISKVNPNCEVCDD
jgi:hypothetical protein